MAEPITRDELFTALADAVGLAQEWDGEGMAPKLAAFGLTVEDVSEVLTGRWEEYAPTLVPDEPYTVFVRGWSEGLLVGAMLAKRAAGADVDCETLAQILAERLVIGSARPSWEERTELNRDSYRKIAAGVASDMLERGAVKAP